MDSPEIKAILREARRLHDFEKDPKVRIEKMYELKDVMMKEFGLTIAVDDNKEKYYAAKDSLLTTKQRVYED